MEVLIDYVGGELMLHSLNLGEIAQTITGGLEDPAEAKPMSNCGQATFRSTYNWDTQAENLLQLCERVFP